MCPPSNGFNGSKLNKPIPKKELLSSATLAFGEAYMNGDLEVEGDFSLMLNTVLKYKDKFTTDFKGLPKIFSNLTSTKKQKEEVTYHYDIGNDFSGGFIHACISDPGCERFHVPSSLIYYLRPFSSGRGFYHEL